MKKFLLDNFFAILSILVAWAVLSFILYFYQINTQLADTTFIAQILENFRHSAVMQTSMGRSIIESMSLLWTQSAEYVCSLPLTPHFTTLPWFHYYFALYLLIPFLWVMSVPVLLAIVQAGIYLSILVFTFYLARKKNISTIGSILITILVSQHPLWIEGIYGQFYVNRLFLLFSALFIWLLEKKKINYLTLGLAGLLAISTNEIYGIALGTIIFSYAWIYKTIDRKIIFLAGIYILYSVISIALIQHNLGLNLPQNDFLNKTSQNNLGVTLSRLAQDFTAEKTQIFLIINLGILGLFTFLSRRTILPFFIILLPNLFINIGGAEKTGWSTHYHASYFIPLIWLSILGIARLNNYQRLQKTLIIGSIVLAVFINPYTGKIRENPLFSAYDLYQKGRSYHSVAPIYLKFRSDLEEAVGPGQSVSLLEPVSYLLYEHETYYYPHNIEGVDNVILRFDKTKSGNNRFSSISYGRQFDPKMDSCIFERMKKNGYDFNNALIVGDWAVIKRN